MIVDIPVSQIAYIDETGVDTPICIDLHREYAYLPKGAAVYGETGGQKFKRAGIAAAQVDGKIISPLRY